MKRALWIDEHMDEYLSPVPETLDAAIEVVVNVYNACLENVKEEQDIAVKKGVVAQERLTPKQDDGV